MGQSVEILSAVVSPEGDYVSAMTVNTYEYQGQQVNGWINVWTNRNHRGYPASVDFCRITRVAIDDESMPLAASVAAPLKSGGPQPQVGFGDEPDPLLRGKGAAQQAKGSGSAASAGSER